MKTRTSKWLTASRAVLAGTVSLLTLASSPTALASSSFINSWEAVYPGSGSANNASCQLCHANSTQQLNPYGAAICNASGGISSRIQSVANANSDADPTGASNLAEAGASTQPGWTPGNVNPTYSRSNCQPSGNVESPPGFIAGNLDPAAGNQTPAASPGGPYNGTAGIALALNGSGSSDPDGSIVSYDWNFGDGSTGSGATPTHTYTGAGTFTVALTVTDDAGATDTATTSATIGMGNQPPVADASGPYSGMVGMAVSFSGSGSRDPDGSIVSYAWDFGDGSTGSGQNPSHTYSSAGMYNVTLTVTDDAGATDSAASTADITLQPVNQPPVADAGGPYSGTAGVAVSFNGSASSDPDGSVAAYDWNFGDGMTGSGATPAHAYSANGNYTVTLTVTDDAGATTSATTTVSIGATNLPPSADAGGPYSGTAGAPVNFDGSGSSDLDGSIVAYDWNFGDGTSGNGVMPAHVYAGNGSYTVTLTVTDDAGDTGTATAAVSIGTGNLPPAADAGGPYRGTEGVALSFDGTASSDPDGSIASYRWDFGDGTTGSGPNPSHSYGVAGTYNVTLEVTDDGGATDSAMTTATVATASPGSADVYLERLYVPRRIGGMTGTTLSQRVQVTGSGDTLAQDATVSLAVAAPAGVSVSIDPASVTQTVTPGDDVRYRFTAAITCTAPGTHVLDWTATIAAAVNASADNDTLSAATTVRCGDRKSGHDDDDDKEDDGRRNRTRD